MDLKSQIKKLIEQNVTDFDISRLIKTNIQIYLKSIEKIFEETDGKDFCVSHAEKIDIFLYSIYKYVIFKYFQEFEPSNNSIPISLIALGSYGREELCVYSDIDLMIVYKRTKGFNTEQIIEDILRLAWDAGVKISHRTHCLDELFDVSNSDITIKTALLESRFVCGSKLLWKKTQEVLTGIQKYNSKEFIEKKLLATQERRVKYPLTMEPNLKEGVGGLRDANTLFWIIYVLHGNKKLKELNLFCDDDIKEYKTSLDFLIKTRLALHLCCGKKQDKLILEQLPCVAKKLGFIDKKNKSAAQQLSTKISQSLWSIKVLTQIFIKKLTKDLFFESKNITIFRKMKIENGIYLHENTIYVPSHFKSVSLKQLIKTLISIPDEKINFDISFIKWARNTILPTHNDSQTYRLFKQLFYKTNLNTILYALHKSGILKYLIKPISYIQNLPQFDGYHIYPVDIHSLKTLYYLENIDDVFIKAIWDDVCEDGKIMLKLTLLMHDIGKGRRTDHSEVGAKLFKNYAKKLNFTEPQIEMGVKLIKNHTLMSNVANREDIYHEKVILSFISKLQDQKTLKLLYILTYCDAKAVNKSIYSNFSARLLKELYQISNDMFDKEELLDETTRRIKKENILKRHKSFLELSLNEQKNILSIKSNFLFFRYKAQEILDLVKKSYLANPFYHEIENQESLIIHIFRKNPFNLGYLLSKLVRLNLVSMEIYQLFDTCKYFRIEFENNIENHEISYVEQLIQESFDMKKVVKITKPTILKNDIYIDMNHSQHLVQMNLNTKNQQGLMAYILNKFDQNSIFISYAKIQTIKNKTRNLFLIEKEGNMCENSDIILKSIY